MREMKLRGWDKKFSRWAGSTPGIIEKYQRALPNVELMQYTGLKDKNGKESYHKDILRSVTGLICTIEYGEYRSRSGTGFGWYLMHLDGDAYMPFPYDLEDWEVISNIWENKEVNNG